MARTEIFDGTRTEADRAPMSLATGDSSGLIVVSRRTTISRLKLGSVLRFAVVFWMCVAALAVTTLIVLWSVLSSIGAVGNFESFVRDATGLTDFHIMSGTVITMLALLIVLGTLIATTLTVAAAMFYNVVAALMGGIEVRCDDELVEIM